MRKASTAAALAVSFIGVSSLSLSPSGAAASRADLALDTAHPGRLFASGAVGLSVEAWELKGLLSAQHRRLVRLLRLLGPAVLRVGGNSVDLSWWTSRGESPPSWATNTVTPADLSALRGLLDATRWRVLLGVDLGRSSSGSHV